jgi:hypothetical protein
MDSENPNQTMAIDEEAVAAYRAKAKAREEQIEKVAKELRAALHGRDVMIVAFVGTEFVVSIDSDDEPMGERTGKAKILSMLATTLNELVRSNYRDAELADWKEEEGLKALAKAIRDGDSNEE